MNKVYIQAATQISIQQPLCEQWMTAPVLHSQPFVKAVNPVFRDFIPPNEARRMGNIMKRAIVTALKVLAHTGVDHPDAIITGTGIGCLDYTERLLDSLTENGEEAFSPTFFMQSTHNTVSSAIAIYTKTHGYNTTYSHGQLSFDLALQDAWMQMQLGNIATALVGGHDEMVDSYINLLCKTGYLSMNGMVPCGEVAVSALLTTHTPPHSSLNSPLNSHLCELPSIRISPLSSHLSPLLDSMLHEAGLTINDISAVMVGTNGKEENDSVYANLANALFPDKTLLHYKHLFGENYTASAFAVYAAAHCLKAGTIPPCLVVGTGKIPPQLTSILLVNQMNGKDCSFTLLKKSEP